MVTVPHGEKCKRVLTWGQRCSWVVLALVLKLRLVLSADGKERGQSER